MWATGAFDARRGEGETVPEGSVHPIPTNSALRDRLLANLRPPGPCLRCERLQNQLDLALTKITETERECESRSRRESELEALVSELSRERERLTERLNEPTDLASELLQQRLREQTLPPLIAATQATPPSSERELSLMEKARATRKLYKVCEIPSDAYHKNMSAVGFAEVVFSAYAAHRGMGEKSVTSWLVDGRVSSQFHLQCVQSLAPEFAWKRTYLTPPDGGNAIEFFFWKVHALKLTLELVLMLIANDQAVTTSAKTHVSLGQLQMATERFRHSRFQFVRSLEQAHVEYLESYVDWPPASEYSKSEPRSWVSRDIQVFSRNKEVQKGSLISERVGPSMLKDHTGESEHLFANDFAAAEALRLSKKKLSTSALSQAREVKRSRPSPFSASSHLFASVEFEGDEEADDGGTSF